MPRVNNFSLVPWLLLLSGVLSLSPIFHAFSPIKGNLISIAGLLIIFAIKLSHGPVNKEYFALFLACFLLASISSVYWGDITLMKVPIYLALSLLVTSQLTETEVQKFVFLLSNIILILLIGSCISVAYAYYGGIPLFHFSIPDGRLSQLYLTSLTNFQVGNLIRPAGIFDEPGTLSFIVCFTAAMRNSLCASKKNTWAILILGFITLSFAHLIYVIFHAYEDLKKIPKNKVLSIMAFIVLCSTMSFLLISPLRAVVSSLFLVRFTADVSPLGYDRIHSLIVAFQYIDFKTIFFGLHSECNLKYYSCPIHYGENPLTLLVHWGLLIAFPYYLSLTCLFISFIKQKNFVVFGVFLLLLQRPYVMNFGYSTVIIITFFILLNKLKKV